MVCWPSSKYLAWAPLQRYITACVAECKPQLVSLNTRDCPKVPRGYRAAARQAGSSRGRLLSLAHRNSLCGCNLLQINTLQPLCNNINAKPPTKVHRSAHQSGPRCLCRLLSASTRARISGPSSVDPKHASIPHIVSASCQPAENPQQRSGVCETLHAAHSTSDMSLLRFGSEECKDLHPFRHGPVHNTTLFESAAAVRPEWVLHVSSGPILIRMKIITEARLTPCCIQHCHPHHLRVWAC